MSNKDKNLTHRIGVIGLGTGPNGRQITAARKLTDTEYEAYKNAVTELRAWVTSDAHSLIGYSLTSLKNTVERCAALYKSPPRPNNPHAVKLAINADFLNLLGNAHLYLNHTETMLKRATYQDADKDLAKFEEVTAYEYDNVFAYRFSYKLRNYAVHCGFPISGFSAHSGFVNGTQEEEHSFEISFKSQELLSNFEKWGAQVKKDLAAQPEQFDAVKIAEDYVDALNRVQVAMIEQYAPRLHKLAATVQETANFASSLEGSPHIISMLPDEEIKPPVTKLDMSIERIPLELVELASKIRPGKRQGN
jgi:hypothetical protein